MLGFSFILKKSCISSFNIAHLTPLLDDHIVFECFPNRIWKETFKLNVKAHLFTFLTSQPRSCIWSIAHARTEKLTPQWRRPTQAFYMHWTDSSPKQWKLLDLLRWGHNPIILRLFCWSSCYCQAQPQFKLWLRLALNLHFSSHRPTPTTRRNINFDPITLYNLTSLNLI